MVAAGVETDIVPGRTALIGPLGVVAGFVDATGGGGWGPISTSTLLSSGRMTPRRTIGSVDTSEFVVAVAASIGFLTALGGEALSTTVVVGLLVGGVLAAPLAAYLVRIMPTRLIGVGAGGLIVLSNTQIILNACDAPTAVQTGIYTTVGTAWVALLAWAIRRTLAERRCKHNQELVGTCDPASELSATRPPTKVE